LLNVRARMNVNDPEPITEQVELPDEEDDTQMPTQLTPVEEAE
jgi:hypothetical protein